MWVLLRLPRFGGAKYANDYDRARTPSAQSHRSPDAASLREAYVKRHKNDSTVAEAICEAITRPNTRFVATKTLEQHDAASYPSLVHSPADLGD
jgi:hypothetical protein